MAVLLWARLGASSVAEGVPVWVASAWSSDETWPFSPAASCSQEGPWSAQTCGRQCGTDGQACSCTHHVHGRFPHCGAVGR